MNLMPKIWLAYGLICVFLSAFLVVIISTSRLFSRSFYRLVVIHLVFTIFGWIYSWPSRIVYTEDTSYFAKTLFQHSPRLFRSFMFLGIALLHVQSWSSIVICINKLRTANPEKYEERNKWWNRWCLLIYGVILILSLLAANYLAIVPSVNYVPELGRLQYTVWSLGDAIMIIFLVAAFIILYILIGLVIGLITICKFRKHQDKGFHHSSVVILAHTFFRVFCLSLLLASFFIRIENFTSEFMFTIFDVMSFSMTFILLIYDENVRMALRTATDSEGLVDE
ncbi:unnamed protein product [Caenorhabditis brenneri]